MAQQRSRSYWEEDYVVERPLGRHAVRSAASYAVQAQPLPREDIPVYPKPPEKQPAQRVFTPPAPDGTARNLRKAKVHFSVGRMVFAGLVFFVLLAMICMNLNLWSTLNELQRQIDTSKRRIANMDEDSARLSDDIKYTMDGEKIRTYAVNKMGMRPPSDEQTRYITLEGYSEQVVP